MAPEIKRLMRNHMNSKLGSQTPKDTGTVQDPNLQSTQSTLKLYKSNFFIKMG